MIFNRHMFSSSVLLSMLLLSGCQSARVPADFKGSVPAPVASPSTAPRYDDNAAFVESPVVKPAEVTPVVVAPEFKQNVALLVPLSGKDQAVGQSLLDAATLAVFDNTSKNIELKPYDTGSDVATAQAAIRQALAEKNTIILGPLFAPQVRSIAPIARNANIPVISFSNDDSVAGSGVYVLGLLPEDQVRRVMIFAQQQGINNFAALVPNTAYGRKAVAAMRGNNAADIIAVEYFKEDLSDLEAAVQKLSSKAATAAWTPGKVEEGHFQALLLPLGGVPLKTALTLLDKNNIKPANVRFLGTSIWQTGGVLSDTLLQGGLLASSSQKVRAAFVQKYKASFERAPLPINGIAYDATALAGLLAKNMPKEPFTVASFGNPNGFAGVDGIFRFTPLGTNQRGLAVFEINGGVLREVSSAPSTFSALVN